MAATVPIAIIGGGITGLSAAWELQKNFPHQPYIVLESSGRWGGKIITERLDAPRTIMDGGPESFVTRKPEVWDLAHELQIEDQIIVPASETKGMNVLHHGTIYNIPLHPIKFIKSNLLSWSAKFRLLAEPFIPARRDMEDETLAQFVERRLGKEMLEKLIGPVLGGIYNADPTTQSILYTSPVMRQMEREHGGLFLGSLARMRAKKKAQLSPEPGFITFKDGSQTLVDTLVQKLSGDLQLNSPVAHIKPLGEQYQIILADGTKMLVSAVILATPSNVAAKLIENFAPAIATQLDSIKQSSLGTMSLVYRASDLPVNEINGLMIPRREERLIDAIQFTSKRIPNRTDENHVLVRIFYGGAAPQILDYEVYRRLELIQSELRDLLNITATPIACRSFCWKASYPQAQVGHLDLVDAIESSLPQTIAMAGASYRGLGVPDCVRQGREAAKHIGTVLESSKLSEIHAPTYA